MTVNFFNTLSRFLVRSPPGVKRYMAGKTLVKPVPAPDTTPS